MATRCSSFSAELSHIVYIALGSNVGDRQALLRQAIKRLGDEVGAVERVSSFIETEPWGFVSSFTFLNAVIVCRTALSPQALLERTQSIERALGRQGKSTGGVYTDRPIDIDILLYDDEIIEIPTLTIPHALMHERAFVLRSMVEVAPDLPHPRLGLTMAELLRDLMH